MGLAGPIGGEGVAFFVVSPEGAGIDKGELDDRGRDAWVGIDDGRVVADFVDDDVVDQSEGIGGARSSGVWKDPLAGIGGAESTETIGDFPGIGKGVASRRKEEEFVAGRGDESEAGLVQEKKGSGI